MPSDLVPFVLAWLCIAHMYYTHEITDHLLSLILELNFVRVKYIFLFSCCLLRPSSVLQSEYLLSIFIEGRKEAGRKRGREERRVYTLKS